MTGVSVSVSVLCIIAFALHLQLLSSKVQTPTHISPYFLALLQHTKAAKLRPVRPETPKLLPAVAAAWPPLLAALRDARVAVVEEGLSLLAHMLGTAGGVFLARRFGHEALPVMLRLLAAGTAHQPTMLSLGTDAVSNAKVRHANVVQLYRWSFDLKAPPCTLYGLPHCTLYGLPRLIMSECCHE